MIFLNPLLKPNKYKYSTKFLKISLILITTFEKSFVYEKYESFAKERKYFQKGPLSKDFSSNFVDHESEGKSLDNVHQTLWDDVVLVFKLENQNFEVDRILEITETDPEFIFWMKTIWQPKNLKYFIINYH